MARLIPENPIEFPNLYPKQKEFVRSNKTFVCYGGARGGGKSFAVDALCMIYCKMFPGIQILLVRRTYKDVFKNHVISLQLKLHCTIDNDPKRAAKWSKDEGSFIFANGSRIVIGYCDNENDALHYQGLAYDVVILEEATQFTEYQYEIFTEIVRPSGFCRVPFKPRMRLTCNPGGVGHEWVKRLFIDRNYKDTENPDDYQMIHAKVYDNAFIMENDQNYVKRLENLPPERRAQMLDGDWNVFSGLFFIEFEERYHVIPDGRLPRDGNYNLYVSLDYGLDMLAAYFIAVTPYNVLVFDEIYESGLIISQAAKKIRQKIDDLGFEYNDFTAILAPDDLWNTSQENGRCKADIWSDYGINLTKSKRDRSAGWLAIKEDLLVDYSLPPEERKDSCKLKIFSKCVNLIRCLPKLQTDPKNSDDCMKEPHELTHAPDSLRTFYTYWLAVPDEVKNQKSLKVPKEVYEDYLNATDEVREYLENKYGKIFCI